MNKEEYSKFLSHPLWQKKREEVLHYYGKVCSKCGKRRNLQVHHKTYSKGKMPWEYPIENFLILCEECHGNHHGYEYSQNYCTTCGKEISNNFVYCLTCHNKLVEIKEKEQKELKNKIVELENSLKDKVKLQGKINSELINRLTKEKLHLANRVNELGSFLKSKKKVDGNRLNSNDIRKLKEEKEDLNNKLKNLELQVKKEKDDLRLKNSIEINRLKQEKEKSLRERKMVEDNLNNLNQFYINTQKKHEKDRKEDNRRIESQISSLKWLIVSTLILALGTSTFFWIKYSNKSGHENINSSIITNREATKDNTPEKIDKKLVDTKSKIEEKNISFGTHNSETKTSYELISIKAITPNIGKKVILKERISQIIHAKNGNIYLNVGGYYPNQKLSLVVFSKNTKNFPNIDKFKQKIVSIKGTLTEYNNKPQIIINKKWQIKLM